MQLKKNDKNRKTKTKTKKIILARSVLKKTPLIMGHKRWELQVVLFLGFAFGRMFATGPLALCLSSGPNSGIFGVRYFLYSQSHTLKKNDLFSMMSGYIAFDNVK